MHLHNRSRILFACCFFQWAVISYAEDSVHSGAIQTLVNTHCVSCHGPAAAEADLRLDTLNSTHWEDVQLWDKIASRIADGEMPPRDSTQESDKTEIAKLLSLTAERLETLEVARLLGQFKKLTATEYSNTLADVLGLPLKKVSSLPFDSDRDLKKLGEHQVVTSYAVQKYYDVASRYLDRLIFHEPIVTRVKTFTAANGKDLLGRQYTSKEGALAGGGNEPIFILRSPVTKLVEEGEYELTFKWKTFYVPPNVRLKLTDIKSYESTKELQAPTIKVFTRAGEQVLNPLKVWKDDKQAECRMDQPIRLLLNQDAKFLSLRGPNNLFRQTPDKDPRYAKIESSNLSKEEKRRKRKALDATIKRELHDDKTMYLLITQASFHGPLNKQVPASHQVVFGKARLGDDWKTIPPIISRLATRLYRRPVSDDILQKYYAIAKREYDESKNVYLAVKVTLNTMLCSPHMVFKYEGNQQALDDYMIASRMSYFLWNSAPDQQLLRLAERGELQDPNVRRQQAQRMLLDRSKADRFTQNFTYQWLGLHKLDDYTPNEAYMRTIDYARLKPHLAREPQAFFNEVLHSNLSALNLIDSDFVVWNNPLYGLYNSGGVKVDKPHSNSATADTSPDSFRRLPLKANPDRIRGGLASMSSILSLTTDGENTQPILRGVWIARRLLGIDIQPPATVPAIEINLENVSKPRDVLAKHKSDSSCYACHVKFDHLGLAMENFDVLGRWKTDYVHPVLGENNRFKLVKREPIDSASETPDGESMVGIAGVKSHLMDNKKAVMKNLIKTLFSYSLGREVRYRDRATIDALLESMQENDYRLRDVILEMVASKSFSER